MDDDIFGSFLSNYQIPELLLWLFTFTFSFLGLNYILCWVLADDVVHWYGWRPFHEIQSHSNWASLDTFPAAQKPNKNLGFLVLFVHLPCPWFLLGIGPFVLDFCCHGASCAENITVIPQETRLVAVKFGLCVRIKY